MGKKWICIDFILIIGCGLSLALNPLNNI